MITHTVESVARELRDIARANPTTINPVMNGFCRYRLVEDGKVHRCIVGAWLYSHGVETDIQDEGVSGDAVAVRHLGPLDPAVCDLLERAQGHADSGPSPWGVVADYIDEILADQD